MTNEYGLNIRQKLFVDLYLNTDDMEYCGNGTKCYQAIYDCDYDTARANASDLLAKSNIKDYIESKQLSTNDILERNRNKLVEHALKLGYGIANQGNTSVLNKLLDKIMPTVLESNNTNTNLSPDEMLRAITEKALNKSDNKTNIDKSEEVQNADIPVTSSNNNDLQK